VKLKNKNKEKGVSRDSNSCLLQSDGRSRFTDLAEISYQTKNKPTNSNDNSLLGEKSWTLELVKCHPKYPIFSKYYMIYTETKKCDSYAGKKAVSRN